MEKVVLFDIDYTLFNTRVYKDSSLTHFSVYDEVIEVLREVSTMATVGVFSEGELEHQLRKLIATNIKEFIHDDHMHIFTKKLSALADVLINYQGKQLFFIDDKLEVLQAIKQMDPTIYTIWVKRGEYAESVPEIEGFQPDAEVIDLKKVIEIIHNK